MTRTLPIALAVAVLGAGAGYAAEAWSAPAPTPTEKALLRDVKTLTSQVKTLQGNVKTLQTNVKKLQTDTQAAALTSVAAILADFCSAAITADAIQGTWQVIDQLSAATQAGKTFFGAQTPVDDTINGQSVCQNIGVVRSQSVPPTVTPFASLLGLLRQ